MFNSLGIQELILILIVGLIIFGPKRLPELGKTLGKGIVEFKKSIQGIKEDIETRTDSPEENNHIKKEQE